MKHAGKVDDPPTGLIQVGPLISVRLMPPPEVVNILAASKQPTPSAEAKLLIDTGAASSSVRAEFPRALGLRPIRFAPILGVSETPDLFPVYRMTVLVTMDDGDAETNCGVTVDAIGMPHASHAGKVAGLLGRDFLQCMQFIYDGPTGTYELISRQRPASSSKKTRGNRSKGRPSHPSHRGKVKPRR